MCYWLICTFCWDLLLINSFWEFLGETNGRSILEFTHLTMTSKVCARSPVTSCLYKRDSFLAFLLYDPEIVVVHFFPLYTYSMHTSRVPNMAGAGLWQWLGWKNVWVLNWKLPPYALSWHDRSFWAALQGRATAALTMATGFFSSAYVLENSWASISFAQNLGGFPVLVLPVQAGNAWAGNRAMCPQSAGRSTVPQLKAHSYPGCTNQLASGCCPASWNWILKPGRWTQHLDKWLSCQHKL